MSYYITNHIATASASVSRCVASSHLHDDDSISLYVGTGMYYGTVDAIRPVAWLETNGDPVLVATVAEGTKCWDADLYEMKWELADGVAEWVHLDEYRWLRDALRDQLPLTIGV